MALNVRLFEALAGRLVELGAAKMNCQGGYPPSPKDVRSPFNYAGLFGDRNYRAAQYRFQLSMFVCVCDRVPYAR